MYQVSSALCGMELVCDGAVDNLRLLGLGLLYRLHITFSFFIILTKVYLEDPCRSDFPGFVSIYL